MSTELVKVNLGCGEQKLEGFINIDSEEMVKPDMLHDFRKADFPFEDDSVDMFYCLHNLEHIEYRFWPRLFQEIFRILKPEGTLLFGYPEWEICAKNFMSNYLGQRDYWRMTLYGRQLWPGDFHVTPVVTTLLKQYLAGWGFKDFESTPEPAQPHNTLLRAKKGFLLSRGDVINYALLKKEDDIR